MHFFRSQDRMRLSILSSLRSRCDQRGQRPLPPRHLDQVLLQVVLVAVMFSPWQLLPMDLLSDPRPIIGTACHPVPNSLTHSCLVNLIDTTLFLWRCQPRTCWSFYCCWWWWWWRSCWTQPLGPLCRWQYYLNIAQVEREGERQSGADDSGGVQGSCQRGRQLGIRWLIVVKSQWL